MPRPKHAVVVRCLGPYGEHTFRRPPGSAQRICNRCQDRINGCKGQLWRGIEAGMPYVDTRTLSSTAGKLKRPPSRRGSAEGDQ
jgi:hypothetical protein